MNKNILKLLIILTTISITISNTIYAVDLIRDNVKKIISDISTNLMWQDDATTIQKDWSNAITYCEDLTLGGYDGWRLPNRFELISLIDYTKSSPAIKENAFQFTTSNYYWGATSYVHTSSNAWYVNFESGYTHNNKDKSNSYYVRCVRAR